MYAVIREGYEVLGVGRTRRSATRASGISTDPFDSYDAVPGRVYVLHCTDDFAERVRNCGSTPFEVEGRGVEALVHLPWGWGCDVNIEPLAPKVGDWFIHARIPGDRVADLPRTLTDLLTATGEVSLGVVQQRPRPGTSDWFDFTKLGSLYDGPGGGSNYLSTWSAVEARFHPGIGMTLAHFRLTPELWEAFLRRFDETIAARPAHLRTTREWYLGRVAEWVGRSSPPDGAT